MEKKIIEIAVWDMFFKMAYNTFNWDVIWTFQEFRIVDFFLSWKPNHL